MASLARQGVLATMLLLSLDGCAGISDGQVFQVSIVNDRSQPVVVRDCDDYCSSSPLRFDLQPGGSTPINRTTHMHSYFSVTSPAGEHLGCVDLYFPTPQPGARVPVSQAVSCPGHVRPRWETFGLILLGVLVLAGPFFFVRRR